MPDKEDKAAILAQYQAVRAAQAPYVPPPALPPPAPEAPRRKAVVQQQATGTAPSVTPPPGQYNPNMPQTPSKAPKVLPPSPYAQVPKEYNYDIANNYNPYLKVPAPLTLKTQPGQAGAGYKKPKNANPNMPQTPSQAPGAGKPTAGYNQPVKLPPLPPYPYQYQPDLTQTQTVTLPNGTQVQMPLVPTVPSGPGQQVVLHDKDGNVTGVINIDQQPAMPGGYVGQDALQQAIIEATFLANSLPPSSQVQTFDLGGGVTVWVPPATLQGVVPEPTTGGGPPVEDTGGRDRSSGGNRVVPETPALPETDVDQSISDLQRIPLNRVTDFPPRLQDILRSMGGDAGPSFLRLMQMLGFTWIGQIGPEGWPSDVIVPGEFNLGSDVLAYMSGLDADTQRRFTAILYNMLGIQLPTAQPPAPVQPAATAQTAELPVPVPVLPPAPVPAPTG